MSPLQKCGGKQESVSSVEPESEGTAEQHGNAKSTNVKSRGSNDLFKTTLRQLSAGCFCTQPQQFNVQ